MAAAGVKTGSGAAIVAVVKSWHVRSRVVEPKGSVFVSKFKSWWLRPARHGWMRPENAWTGGRVAVWGGALCCAVLG